MGDEGIFSAPLVDLESARLVFHSEGVRLSLRAGDLAGALYQARFEGPVPDVKVKDGVVTIRYPRRLWVPSMEKRAAEVTLSTAIPWHIVIRAGDRRSLPNWAVSISSNWRPMGQGACSTSSSPSLRAWFPSGLVAVAPNSPSGVRRASLPESSRKGWGSGVVFDDQTVSGMSSDGRLQSPNYEGAALRYDIETSGSGSMITITTG